FERFHGPKMLKVAGLDVQGREQGVENQREELSQLEKMYKGTQLATDTKEIVVERARRALEMAEQWLAIARQDQSVPTDHAHHNRERDLRDEARWAEQK